MPDWPPRRYTVLRVYSGGHRAELLGDEDDDFLDAAGERAWHEQYRPALLMSRAYAEVGPAGESLVVSFVIWDEKS